MRELRRDGHSDVVVIGGGNIPPTDREAQSARGPRDLRAGLQPTERGRFRQGEYLRVPVPAVDDGAPARRVAVIGGAGLMGHGIALACLQAGHVVTIVSRSEESAQRGIELVRHGPFGLDRAVSRGKILPDRAESLVAMVIGTADMAGALDGADFVFESVPGRRAEARGTSRG